MRSEHNTGGTFYISPESILAVDVFLEARKSRVYVGRLERLSRAKQPTKEKQMAGNGFKFTYDNKYLYYNSAIPLGPDLPLTKREFSAKELFPAFTDRIPSRSNPAFREYCEKFGLSTKETDPIILLPTIARRGPSAFVFEPVLADEFSAVQLAGFRKELGLTLRDFAIAFDIAPATLQKIESGKATGRDVLKRLELYFRFPEVAKFELKRNQSRLHGTISEKLMRELQVKSSNSRQKSSKASQ